MGVAAPTKAAAGGAGPLVCSPPSSAAAVARGKAGDFAGSAGPFAALAIDIQQLNEEAIEIIFTFLPVEDRRSAAAVCRLWRRVHNSSTKLWGSVLLSGERIMQVGAAWLLGWGQPAGRRTKGTSRGDGAGAALWLVRAGQGALRWNSRASTRCCVSQHECEPATLAAERRGPAPASGAAHQHSLPRCVVLRAGRGIVVCRQRGGLAFCAAGGHARGAAVEPLPPA